MRLFSSRVGCKAITKSLRSLVQIKKESEMIIEPTEGNIVPRPIPSHVLNTNHAVVIGGSMAGLLAARSLCDHFERVTIVERDRFSQGPVPRKGVPQARQ